jgi:hypothetical protein
VGKHEIINVDNYLLVVNDEAQKENDWVLFNRLEVLRCTHARNGEFVYIGSLRSSSNHHHSNFKKIIAHLPLKGAPYLEGVELIK